MLKNIIKTAFRNVMKYKGYSFISIFSLALGLTCFIMIFNYVQHELSFDTFHENREKIFRLTEKASEGGKEHSSATVCSAAAGEFTQKFPEIENNVRILNKSIIGQTTVKHQGNQFRENRFLYVDPSFFNVFSFPLIAGDPRTALTQPNTIVITKSTALKYFGQENPLGKTLLVDQNDNFEVTGVIEDCPANSHIQFDFLASLNTLKWPERSGWNSSWCFATYFLLKSPDSLPSLQGKINRFVQQELGYTENSDTKMALVLQPLSKIHLFSNMRLELTPNGDIKYILIFSAIAIFVLIIACINYINLSTARAAIRAKEVGVRKVNGANKIQLCSQFLGESVVITFLALFLALIMTELLSPIFSGLTGQALSFGLTLNLETSLLLVLGGLLLGFLTGLYPALVLSSFRSVQIFKFRLTDNPHQGGRLRKGLVIFQFATSIVLIISTIIVAGQLHYIQDKKLGYEKSQVVALPMDHDNVALAYQGIKNELLTHSHILNATAVSEIPCNIKHHEGIRIKVPLSQYSAEDPLMNCISVDKDFLQTMKIEMIKGQWFLGANTEKDENVYIINEAALQAVDWGEGDIIGRNIRYKDGAMKAGPIVGVVKNFHFDTLHNKIQPLVLLISPRRYQFLLVKTDTRDLAGTLSFIKKTWRSRLPQLPFEYTFLDQEFDAMYRKEKNIGRLFFTFALIAIAIACMGLLGLFTFMTAQRTKEIGVRKVLGASVPEIIGLLAKDLSRSMLIANIIAWPAAWYAMHKWLQNFAYRTSIGWETFLVAGLLMLVTALLTVSFHAFRAATANPVESLRYE